MMTLRRFIREELTWNYWMRRPRNNMVGDVSDRIETQRQATWGDEADDFRSRAEALKHDVEVAHDIQGILSSMEDRGFDPYEVVEDMTDYGIAMEKRDVESVRDAVLRGLDRYVGSTLSSSSSDSYDTSPMSHPLRPVQLGGVNRNGKRSMGF